jgi:hypothetical protein
MTGEKFEVAFSDEECAAALQDLVKLGHVDIIVDANGEQELRLTKVGEAYAKWLFITETAPAPYAQYCSLAYGSLASAGANSVGEQVFLDP